MVEEPQERQPGRLSPQHDLPHRHPHTHTLAVLTLVGGAHVLCLALGRCCKAMMGHAGGWGTGGDNFNLATMAALWPAAQMPPPPLVLLKLT